MFRGSTLVLLLALGGLTAPGMALAQLVPPAGSAGAGGSAISGVPYGPANPSVLSDPSGIGNASRLPPLGTNTQPPPTSYGSVNSQPAATRVVTPPPYAGASQPIYSARQIGPGKPRARGRSRAQTGTFTGICRGC